MTSQTFLKYKSYNKLIIKLCQISLSINHIKNAKKKKKKSFHRLISHFQETLFLLLIDLYLKSADHTHNQNVLIQLAILGQHRL